MFVYVGFLFEFYSVLFVGGQCVFVGVVDVVYVQMGVGVVVQVLCIYCVVVLFVIVVVFVIVVYGQFVDEVVVSSQVVCLGGVVVELGNVDFCLLLVMVVLQRRV